MSQLSDGEYHLGVDVWIKNENGEYLIQKRSELKKRLPGIWMATGGAVISRESGIEAVVRETAEEMGVQVDTSKLTLLFKSKFSNCINEIWLLQQNVELSDISMQLNEVSEVKWVSKDEIIEMVMSKEMIDYGMNYINTVFEEKILSNMLILDED